MVRLLWIAAGWSAFGLGVVGAALPLLPTVPFMLLAAFCFGKGSRRFHDWLLDHPRFGGPIRDWREHGAISRNAKRWAFVAIAFSFVLSFVMNLSALVIGVQALALGGALTFIFTRPDRPTALVAQGAGEGPPASSARNS